MIKAEKIKRYVNVSANFRNSGAKHLVISFSVGHQLAFHTFAVKIYFISNFKDFNTLTPARLSV